ncbi:MAG TPA: VWA domain-containing protein [Candidatus Limnocylindrales bacterium]|nr:VWA domain-containing protein [Candidatus Limnocylindrales bacterium]
MRAETVAANLLVLPRILRARGVATDAEHGRLLLRALAAVDLSRPDDVRAACRAVLVRRPVDLAPFDEEFARFWAWLRGGAAWPEPVRAVAPRPPEPEDIPLASLTGRAPPRTERAVRVIASAAEQLRGRDFAAMSADERAAAARFLERLRWSPGERRGRRFRRAASGARIDARATFHRMTRDGGEAMELVRRRPIPQRRPLVLLCDVSGSMEAYTRVLLHLSHALARRWGRVEAFTFGTRLTRITRHLRHRRPDAAVAEVARAVPDWSGGTRIADTIAEFSLRWSRRVLGRGAVVLLCTDGWERGDPAKLAEEAARLQRSSYRLIWLDPFSATEGYVPESGGARALVRHVDDHLSAATLDGLLAVATLLERAGRGRPVRRQGVGRP